MTPARKVTAGLTIILVQIGLMDLSLSIDNVIAAVGLAPKDPSGDPVMWPIYAGVFIAIIALQAIAPHAVNLLKKYPILEPTAFVLIGYVGILLMVGESVRVSPVTSFTCRPTSSSQASCSSSGWRCSTTPTGWCGA